jgi:hypothetical protein
MRVVNWLNRADAPILQTDGSGEMTEQQRFQRFMAKKAKYENEQRTA